jgi:uncharacterized protein YbjT (DUF2867 family)
MVRAACGRLAEVDHPHSRTTCEARAKIIDVSAPGTPEWWEDTDLAVAVAEVEEFVGSAGWDAPPQLFALVNTADLLAAQPGLATSLGSTVYTPIAQDSLPEGDLSDALAQISWPDEVAGCVLVQEIVVLPPGAEESLSDDPVMAAEQAASHPNRTEARLAAGVLRDGPGGACLMRMRGEHDDAPLRGGDLAPNLLAALKLTFDT